MRLQEFIDKHGMNLSKETLGAAREGLARMKKSVDPAHAQDHVYGLLYELDLFLKHETPDVDLEVLLPAICWHDVWKSTQHQTTNLLKFLYQQWNDGRGSAKIFKRYAKTHRVPKAKEITYAIRSHARFFVQFLDRSNLRTTEAKVLRDIDLLDGWHRRRFHFLIDKYLKMDEYMDYRLIRIALWWYKNVTKKTSPKQFYFEYCRKEFLRRKQILDHELRKLWEEKDRYVHPSDLKKLERLRL